MKKVLATVSALALLSGCAMSGIEPEDVALEQARSEARAACVRARADADQARMAAIAGMDPASQGYALMADAMARQAEALGGKDVCASGLGAYEARERADLFRRFNLQMVEEMVAMAENDAASRVAVFKRTSDMLTGIINEDRNHLSLVQRHGWQGTEEGRHTGDIADEPQNKPSA